MAPPSGSASHSRARPRDAGALADVARRAADGRLRVTVGETYPLEEAPAAQESVATGHGRGKIVLLVD